MKDELIELEERKNKEIQHWQWLLQNLEKEKNKIENDKVIETESYRNEIFKLQVKLRLMERSASYLIGRIITYPFRRVFRKKLTEARKREFRKNPQRSNVNPKYTDALVSVVVINFNGKEHLEDLFQSLNAQSYQPIEIIVVDNNSTDGSQEYIKTKWPNVKLILNDRNDGFAEANNIGLEFAKGEFIALLNNDMKLDSVCIENLVKSINESDKIGAVGSKIRFWEKFAELEFEADNEDLLLDISHLKESLRYKKIFSRDIEFEYDRQNDIEICKIKGLKLLVPADSLIFGINIRIIGKLNQRPVNISCGSEKFQIMTPNNNLEMINFSNANKYSKWVINNAGTEINNNALTCDIGFGEFDVGQYDVKRVVTGLCGGAMMLRRSALEGDMIFSPHMFAYYEDSDLSMRLINNGYRLEYIPDSIVYHKHASTSKEKSSTFRYYVTRNSFIFKRLHRPHFSTEKELTKLNNNLNHLKSYYVDNGTAEEKKFSERIPELLESLDSQLNLIDSNQFYHRERRSIRSAVYNAHWNTLGGGEHHAAVIAYAMQKYGVVDLMSETNFNISDIEDRFGIDLKNCRKVIISAEELHHNKQTTEKYDVFVNSTFGSNLTSHAKRSFYIISFPFRTDTRTKHEMEFLKSYDLFLANSKFTKFWTEKWWGIDNVSVLYPSVKIPSVKKYNKEKIILNVGRFFRNGHNKKQLEIVKVFKTLVDSNGITKDWKLVLVGQLNPDGVEYYEEVSAEAKGYNIDIINNVELKDLTNIYERASIYVHATGLNENLKGSPELQEHFGISTVEAMGYGCIPIVIMSGGQIETVIDGETGFLFESEDELKKQIRKLINLIESDDNNYLQMKECCINRAKEFSRTKSINNVCEKVASYIPTSNKVYLALD